MSTLYCQLWIQLFPIISLYGCLRELNRRNRKAGHVLSLCHSFTQHLPNHLIRVMNWMACTPVRFVDGTKWRGTANILEGIAAIQRGLGLLEKWVQSSLLKFKEKCKSLQLFCQGRAPCNNTDWDGGQLCRRAPGGPGRHQVEHETAECPGSKVGQQHPRL